MFGFLKLPVEHGAPSLITWINRIRSVEGNEEDIGTRDKRTVMKINGPPSGFENIRKWIEARLISMHGTNYVTHFSNINCSKVFKMLVALLYT